MDAGSLTILAASSILVLVASLPAVPGGRVKLGVATHCAAIVITALLGRRGIRAEKLAPDTNPSMVLRGAAYRLATARTKNVLILEGGSYPARAVDERLVEGELARRGYSATVVQIALGAANHFERYQLHDDILHEVDGPNAGQHYVFLTEVQYSYDSRPLAQLEENEDTARTYHNLTPANAYYGLSAVLFGGARKVDRP